MNQTNTERGKDAAGNRREYVWKMTKAIAVGVVGSAIVITFVILAIGIATGSQHISDVNALRMVGFIVAGLIGGWLCVVSENRRLAIPHVPPVREQIAALSADQILVRSSDEPSATPEELLRAAHTGLVEQAEELLRAEEAQSR